MASVDGFEVEEWDADFLDQLVQAEELALSSSTIATQHHHPPPAPPAIVDSISYSPPRELSQRVPPDTIAASLARGSYHHRLSPSKEQEIDCLKRELGRVSKQLILLEKECLELRKERDKKEDQLKSASFRSQTKAETAAKLGSSSLSVDPRIPFEHHNANASNKGISTINVECKAAGVQTDKTYDLINLNDKKISFCSNKLLAIWDLSSSKEFEKSMVSNLFVSCEEDLGILFGYLNPNLQQKSKGEPNEYKKDIADHLRPAQSAEMAKVPQFYSILAKVGNGMAKLEDLIEALSDLCGLKNIVVVYRSLRILRSVLHHTFSVYQKHDRRDNILIEGPSSESETDMIDHGKVPFQTRLFDAQYSYKNQVPNSSPSGSLCFVNWTSLFEHVYQVAITNEKEHIRLEAFSIMNMILARSNAYLERDKFCWELVFQSIPELLRKDAGPRVQKQVVHLLYLLVNCPKVMATFCSSCGEEIESACSTDVSAGTSAGSRGSCDILEGLAGCLASNGNGAEDLRLRRNVIILLAFLASSGKSGFEILFRHMLKKRSNFFEIILQSLVSDLDLELSESAYEHEVFKERTLLIRETLIFLNRLVSNPHYSIHVLQALTSRRDTASLTVEAANRLSHRRKFRWQEDNITRQIRESEILDLGRSFKKRVFAFIGDFVS